MSPIAYAIIPGFALGLQIVTLIFTGRTALRCGLPWGFFFCTGLLFQMGLLGRRLQEVYQAYTSPADGYWVRCAWTLWNSVTLFLHVVAFWVCLRKQPTQKLRGLTRDVFLTDHEQKCLRELDEWTAPHE